MKPENIVKFVDDNSFDLDTLLSYAEIRKEVLWVEKNYQGRGALHLPIEDGDIEDGHIQYHLDNMLNDVWDGYASDVKPGDRLRFLKLAQNLLAMDIVCRELVINGTCFTSKLFDYLYND